MSDAVLTALRTGPKTASELQDAVLAEWPAGLFDRLMAKVELGPNGCWNWTGWRNYNGYGEIEVRKKKTKTHRVAYEVWVGAIPDGLEIDHLCFNRACCNPDHLEAVTHRVNSQRAKARQTHCKHGHEFTPENTKIGSNGEGRSSRRCRTCARLGYVRRKESRAAGDTGATSRVSSGGGPPWGAASVATPPLDSQLSVFG